MNAMTCETAKDLLPGLVAGRLDGATAAAVEAHVGGCAACAGERAVLALVHASAPVAPAGLEARIVRAVRADAGRVRTRTPVRTLAIAAGTAFALLTGGLLVRQTGDRATGGEVAGVTVGWPALQEPLLRATPALHDLSVEELESLLAELES